MAYSEKRQEFLNLLAQILNNNAPIGSIDPETHKSLEDALLAAIDEHVGDNTVHSGGLPEGVIGDLLLHTGTAWSKLAKGATNQLLTMGAELPAWVTPSFSIMSLIMDNDGHAKAIYEFVEANNSWDLKLHLKNVALINNITGKKLYLAASTVQEFSIYPAGILYVDIAEFNAATGTTIQLSRQLDGTIPANSLILSNFIGDPYQGSIKNMNGELMNLIRNYYSNNSIKYLAPVDGVLTLDLTEPLIEEYIATLDGTNTTITTVNSIVTTVDDKFKGRILFKSIGGDTQVVFAGALKTGTILVPRTIEHGDSVGFNYSYLSFWEDANELLWSFTQTINSVEIPTITKPVTNVEPTVSGEYLLLSLDHSNKYLTNFTAIVNSDVHFSHDSRLSDFQATIRLSVVDNTIKLYSSGSWDKFDPCDQRVNVGERYIELVPGTYFIVMQTGLYHRPVEDDYYWLAQYKVSARFEGGDQNISLPKLTQGKIWKGDENGKPVEVSLPSPYDLAFALSDETSDLTTDNDGEIEVIRAQTIESITLAVNVAPTGSSILSDVKKNGVSILTTPINLPAASKTVTITTPQIDVVALTVGDRLQADITQIGATVAGAGAKIYPKTNLV